MGNDLRIDRFTDEKTASMFSIFSHSSELLVFYQKLGSAVNYALSIIHYPLILGALPQTPNAFLP